MPRLRPDDLPAVLAGLPPARHGWVAFSGGLDSTVLLHALAAVRDRLGFALRAVHLDHGLQADSAAWARHCARISAALDVPLTSRAIVARAAPGESPEAAARAARYGALAELLTTDDLLLAAHHQDDQAETLLLALLRGSGVQGLAGMPRIARLGQGYLVRPLLAYARADLRDYAECTGLVWIEDPSNQSVDHDRNLLRHQVLPVLRQRWPAAARTLARSASHCAEAAQILDQTAVELLARLAVDGGPALSAAGLRELAPPHARALLRYWIRARGLPVPGQAQLERILTEVLTARPDADPLVAWAGGEVRRYRGRLFALTPLPPRPAAGLAIAWTGHDELVLPGGLGRLSRWSIAGTEDLCRCAWTVRFAVQGVRWQPWPGVYRRTLKGLFQQVGIPPWLRPYVPLVFADGELVAVAGVAGAASSGGVGLAVGWTGHPWVELGIFCRSPTTRDGSPPASGEPRRA